MDNPKRILVTGATGFIGGAIAHRWAALGLGRLGEVKVRALVRGSQSDQARNLAKTGVELIEGDLREPASRERVVRNCDLVIHAADETRLSNPNSAWETGVEATQKFYEAAASAGVRRFVLVSSMSVYGSVPANLGEDAQPLPFGDPYLDAKIAAEQALLEGSQEPGCPSVTILRFAAVYGPGSQHWTQEPVHQARRRMLAVPGTGDFPFPYLYVENMVDAVTAAAVTQVSGIYNIFDGVTSYREFMRYYANMARTRLRSTPLAWVMGRAALDEFAGQATGRYPRLNRNALQAMLNTELPAGAKANKAMRELGWQPRIHLEEGMAIIERSNGFHQLKKDDPDPWKENEDWVEKEQ